MLWRRRCRPVFLASLLLAGIGAGGGALAQEPPGRAVGVIPDASALRSDGARPLALQHPVYMGDRIQTGPNGEAQINFIDSTRLVVGPTSSLLIDSSVMRNRKTMSSFVVSALRGSFRFISGTSPKPAYAIRTPTGTIGVRGTQFDLTVLSNGGTEFVLLHGRAQICDRFGNCVMAQRGCTAISIPPNGPMRVVSEREERNDLLRAHFPYVRSQNGSLRPEFRADVGSCGSLAASREPDSRDITTGAVPAALPLPAPVRPQPAQPPAPVVVTPSPPPSVTPPSKPDKPHGGHDKPHGGPGNGNGNAGNHHGGGNVHGSGPGTGNNGINNGHGGGPDRGGSGSYGGDRGARSDAGGGSRDSGGGYGGGRDGGNGGHGGGHGGQGGDRGNGGGNGRGGHR